MGTIVLTLIASRVQRSSAARVRSSNNTAAQAAKVGPITVRPGNPVDVPITKILPFTDELLELMRLGRVGVRLGNRMLSNQEARKLLNKEQSAETEASASEDQVPAPAPAEEELDAPPSTDSDTDEPPASDEGEGATSENDGEQSSEESSEETETESSTEEGGAEESESQSEETEETESSPEGEPTATSTPKSKGKKGKKGR